MSGKQANQFHITLCFACNADGSQKTFLHWKVKGAYAALADKAQLHVGFTTTQTKQFG